MSHRASIRRQTKVSLAGKTIAEDRVFTSRTTPINPKVMPCILIYIPEENRAKQDPDEERRVLRSVKLIVEGAIAATDPETLEDEADQLLTDIETIMRLNSTLGDTVERTRWRGAIIDVAPGGGTLIAACRAEYDVEVWTDLAAEGAGLDLPEDASFVRPTSVDLESEVEPPRFDFRGHAPLSFGSEKPPFGSDYPEIFPPGSTPTDAFGEERP